MGSAKGHTTQVPRAGCPNHSAFGSLIRGGKQLSIKVMSAVWELDLLPQDKFILLAFADHADDSGFCYPSLYRISWKCGVSKDSIRRCLARMVFKGIVVILSKGTGRGNTTKYQIRTEKGSKMHPFTLEKGSQPALKRVANGAVKGSTLCAQESSLESPITIDEKLAIRKKRSDAERQDFLRIHRRVPYGRP